MLLGAHVGVAGGVGKAPATGRRIGCEAIQIFAKSPQMWRGPPISDEAAAEFKAAVKTEGMRATAVHHGYLLNLANPDPAKRKISATAFLDELGRAEKLGADALIFHPGAHMGSGVAAGIDTLVASLNEAFAATEGYRVRALLENAAGQGTTLCDDFAQLAEILRRIESPKRAGVALDTCHMFASGRDFRTPETYAAVQAEIERTFGFAAVGAFHLNDAKEPLGSHRDRHENIGKGAIGIDGFRPWVTDPRWNDRPGYLETPYDPKDADEYGAYIRDLAALRGLLGAAPAAAKPAARRKPSRTVK